MIRLFFKIAIRSLKGDKNNSILNIVGLVSCIIAFLYIMTHVFNEYSYDRFHTNADREFAVIASSQEESY